MDLRKRSERSNTANESQPEALEARSHRFQLATHSLTASNRGATFCTALAGRGNADVISLCPNIASYHRLQYTSFADTLPPSLLLRYTTMPRAIISPSVLASDFGQLSAECKRMIKNGAEWLHMG